MKTKTSIVDPSTGKKVSTTVDTLAVQSGSTNKYFIYTDEFVELVVQRLYATKKYNVNLDALRENVYIIFDKMFEINTLEEHQTILNNKPLSEIPVLEEFKSLIFPNSVRYDTADRRCKDILIRPEIKKSATVPTLTSYMNAIAFVRGVHKRASNDGLVYAESLRSEKTFNDVGNSRTVKVNGIFKVNYDGDPFIPIPLTEGKNFYYEDYFYTTTAEDVIKEWVNLLY